MDEAKNRDIQAYLNCMEEIKRRTGVVREVLISKKVQERLENERSWEAYVPTAELLAIQLRKVAELIALSSICSNREEYERIRDDFERDWNARLILRDVERINPSFYPKPVETINPSGEDDHPEWVKINDDYLTSENLIDMVEKCGAILHAFNPYREHKPSITSFLKECGNWYRLILKLLNIHLIRLIDRDSLWYVVMKSPVDDKVRLWEFESVEREA